MMRIPSRPQTVRELVKTGFHVWRESLKWALPFALTLAIVNLVYHIILRSLGLETVISNFTVIIFIIVFLILNAAMVYGIHQAMQNEATKFRESLNEGCKKAFPFIIVSILYGFAVLGGLVLLVIPGIMILVYSMFAPYIVITSDKGIFDSIQESFRLVSGRWWYAAAILFVMIFLFFFFSLLFFIFIASVDIFLANIFTALLGSFSSQKEYLTLITEGVLIIIFYPLWYSFFLTLLRDFQARKSENNKYESFRA